MTIEEKLSAAVDELIGIGMDNNALTCCNSRPGASRPAPLLLAAG